jgi:hypothetical protein
VSTVDSNEQKNETSVASGGTCLIVASKDGLEAEGQASFELGLLEVEKNSW